MKYIRLDDLKEWREQYIRSGKAKSYDDMTALQVFINNADVVEVADRPQGEWIIEIDANGNTYGRCSICGMRQYAGQLNFCPDCGAQMKGADDE